MFRSQALMEMEISKNFLKDCNHTHAHSISHSEYAGGQGEYTDTKTIPWGQQS